MKVLYLDCFAGISGDMLLASLLDAGVPIERLKGAIESLSLPYVPTIRSVRTRKFGISANRVEIDIREEKEGRGLHHIERLIEGSSLSARVKELSCRIFRKLGEAEAAIHGTSLDHVHFHEVGAVDSIVDIVGSAVCLEELQIEKVYASALPTFHGYVDCSHGRLPLPAPATLSLLRGVPWRECGVEGELVTPTGAAFLTATAESFGSMPAMRIDRIGYGAGQNDLEIPNVLRVMVGDIEEGMSRHDEVVVMEANIDDMNPQLFEYVMDRLFEAGALDVFVQTIIMKKSRPAFLLTVLCAEDAFEQCRDVVLRETTTLGVRFEKKMRYCLARALRTVETKYGPIRIKLAQAGDGRECNAHPEYEDCAAAARKSGVPLKIIYEAARAALRSSDT